MNKSVKDFNDQDRAFEKQLVPISTLKRVSGVIMEIITL